jgi:hypothetical protein
MEVHLGRKDCAARERDSEVLLENVETESIVVAQASASSVPDMKS